MLAIKWADKENDKFKDSKHETILCRSCSFLLCLEYKKSFDKDKTPFEKLIKIIFSAKNVYLKSPCKVR